MLEWKEGGGGGGEGAKAMAALLLYNKTLKQVSAWTCCRYSRMLMCCPQSSFPLTATGTPA